MYVFMYLFIDLHAHAHAHRYLQEKLYEGKMMKDVRRADAWVVDIYVVHKEKTHRQTKAEREREREYTGYMRAPRMLSAHTSCSILRNSVRACICVCGARRNYVS